MQQDCFTVEEMARIWQVHPRRIQYLCKQQKIDGAFKRAGVWFIPKDAQLPDKHGQSDTARFEFTGTKKKIFDCALKLFVTRGFDQVSVRGIMDAVGIHPSAMYHYFGSKQQILEAAYDFFCHYYPLGRPTMESIEPVLRNGSLSDIIGCVMYDFADESRQHLLDITKLLFQRSAIDERARDIARSLVLEEGVGFAKAVLDRAVEIGRLAPLDTYAMSVLINGIRVFMLHHWLLNDSPGDSAGMQGTDESIYRYAAMALTDLKAPAAGLHA